MITYFLIWSVFAFNALKETSIYNFFGKTTKLFVFLFLSIFIGLRYFVGCDYETYWEIFYQVANNSTWRGLERLEPSFVFLNQIFGRFEYGYHFVNLMLGGIFSFCLIKFCSSLKRPWLALTAAFPYFIIVVAMGYTRQAVGISICLIALLNFEKGKFYRSILIILFATTFHRSALLFLFAPISTFFDLKTENNRLSKQILIRIIASLPVVYLFLNNFITQRFEYFRYGYLEQGMSSNGSLIRVILCVIPSVIFLFTSKDFNFSKPYKRMWQLIAFMSIISLILLLVGIPSTAIDRIALNFIPIQIIVSAYLPDIRFLNLSPFTLKILIIFFSLLIMLVWLSFAVNANCWLPYTNILFNIQSERRFNFDDVFL